jgi:spermidine/putrescine transport system permease protein
VASAVRTRSGRHIGLWTYFWLYLVLLFAPIVLLAVFSLHDSPLLGLPWKGFSLRWYKAMLGSSALLESFRTSLVVAGVSSAIAVVLGGSLGVAVARFSFPGRSLLMAVALAPMVIPYLGLAVALLVTFVAMGVRPSMATLIPGHVVVALPYVLLLVAARAIGVEGRLEEAALDLGANWGDIVRRIYVPLISPALAGGFISAFVLSLDEFYLAFFLSGRNQTLPVYFFSGLRRPELLPPTLALVTVLTVATLTVLVLAEIVGLRGLGGPSRSRGAPLDQDVAVE